MPPSVGIREHVTVDDGTTWAILTDEIDADDAMASGRWIKSDRTAEVRR